MLENYKISCKNCKEYLIECLKTDLREIKTPNLNFFWLITYTP